MLLCREVPRSTLIWEVSDKDLMESTLRYSTLWISKYSVMDKTYQLINPYIQCPTTAHEHYLSVMCCMHKVVETLFLLSNNWYSTYVA